LGWCSKVVLKGKGGIYHNRIAKREENDEQKRWMVYVQRKGRTIGVKEQKKDYDRLGVLFCLFATDGMQEALDGIRKRLRLRMRMRMGSWYIH